MATCDNDHDPITFEGEFRALCPLCAMRRKMEEAEEAALESAADDLATEELARMNAQTERDEALAKLDKMEEERDGWEERAEEFRKEAEEWEVKAKELQAYMDEKGCK